MGTGKVTLEEEKPPGTINRVRGWFAKKLGVGRERKAHIYVDLSRSVTLFDPAYWLQILFAAGIATLGLILNSPAVIIGAMLISPLMGPILAGGLALASGDVVLGLRAVVNLALSCLAAVLFAVLLVMLLPFKEMTAEIAARTQPTTLDLVVALFSGAIGSIATCKEVKGVVTSIPGVAIAVALMPPLCVVGYGLGLAVSLNGAEGVRVARGGGLLFLTNLVAITFMAMIVFLLLHLDTREVKREVRRWRMADQESMWVRNVFGHIPVPKRVKKVGGLPGRFLLILIPILAILIPLSESFSRLRREITHQQQENRIRRAATEVWQQRFGSLPDGEARSTIDQLSVSDGDGNLSLRLRVFTSKPCTPAEKEEYARLVATRLGTPPQSLALQLTEVPTASGDLAARAREEKRVESPPTVAELQTSFRQGIESALDGLRLPPPARFVSYRVVTSPDDPIDVEISYLSDHEIAADAQTLIAEEVKSRLGFDAARVRLLRIADSTGPIVFGRNQVAITSASAMLLDRIGGLLQQEPRLTLEIDAGTDVGEADEIANRRAQAIAEYLTSKWKVGKDRLVFNLIPDLKRSGLLKLGMADGAHQ
jgi:uncharacterized hydrophobic protein (TIGR00271 family)